MKCRHCTAGSRVLETRVQHEFILLRRRECTGPKSHRFNTVEVLQQFLGKLGGKARRDTVLGHLSRGAARRRLAATRTEEIRKRRLVGEKQLFIAAELGVSQACVRDHMTKLRNGVPAKRGRPKKGESRC